MSEHEVIPVSKKSWWQKVDSYDLRLAVLATGLAMLSRSVEWFLWWGVLFLSLVFVARMLAPRWRFIELDPADASTGFVTVVLHWVSLLGLWLAVGFFVWDPVQIPTASFMIGCVVYGIALCLAQLIHSFDTSDDGCFTS